MTFSQKVSRFFEGVGYVLLLPALAMMYLGLLTGLLYSPIAGLIIWTTILLGFVLFVGFFKHSRGRLSSKGSVRFWIGAMIYNLAQIILQIYLCANYDNPFGLLILILSLPFFVLSSLALHDDLRRIE